MNLDLVRLGDLRIPEAFELLRLRVEAVQDVGVRRGDAAEQPPVRMGQQTEDRDVVLVPLPVRRVREILSPELGETDRRWLEEKTAPLIETS